MPEAPEAPESPGLAPKERQKRRAVRGQVAADEAAGGYSYKAAKGWSGKRQ